jgi:hypothetical protein
MDRFKICFHIQIAPLHLGEALRRALAVAPTPPGGQIAYIRWLIAQIVMAATDVDVATTGASESAVVGSSAAVGPLGVAMATVILLIPLADGRAVQLDPMQTKLKAPGSQRLKLKCDDLL